LSSILIPATKSLTVTNKFPNGNINDETIIIGSDGIYNYISYLFFDISAIPVNISISNAELILFKTNKFYNDSKKEFSIYQISEYFSTFTTFNNPPKVNPMIKKVFYPITSKVAVSVNLTYLVSLWLKNKQVNTSIALVDMKNSILAEFGSANNENKYLIPFINVSIISNTSNKCNCFANFNCNNVPTTKQIEVIGTVAAASKYEAIVNVGVKRNGSGHTDNYYVTDEYDNSLSGNPIFVDKTYNMAIIPKEMPGDVETVAFYGSYKE